MICSQANETWRNSPLCSTPAQGSAPLKPHLSSEIDNMMCRPHAGPLHGVNFTLTKDSYTC